MTNKWATEEETKKYLQLHSIDPTKKKNFDSLYVSSLGIGTYLGNADDATDKAYEETLLKAALSGINFFDTAINYRSMRSEKVLGRVIKLCMEHGVQRDQLVIATKGGYLPFEGNSYEDYVRKTFLDTGILETKDIVLECHSMTKRFLESQIQMSLNHLGLDCIDLYYLHNPEVELAELSVDDFYRRLGEAFIFLEEKVREEKIRRYGLATWNGFRAKKGILDLDRIMQLAMDAGGEKHHFKAIQVPFNLVMMEVVKQDLLQKVNEHKLSLMISAPLMQGKIQKLSSRVFEELPSGKSKISQALEYVLSTPGVSATFCGVKNLEHLVENLSLLSEPTWPKDVWEKASETLGIEPAKKDS